MARVVLHFDGRAIEPGELPAGEYIVARYKPRKLTLAEEEGIRAGLRSIAEGRTVPWKQVHAELDEMLKAKRQRRQRRRK
jgi:hypothetical protein